MPEPSTSAGTGQTMYRSELRALIRRMATENHPWAAPRIHGKLLKLGFVVFERTVARYLADRLRRAGTAVRTCGITSTPVASRQGREADADDITPVIRDPIQ
jgi:hypothetical protein